jgi:hypothetical protein
MTHRCVHGEEPERREQHARAKTHPFSESTDHQRGRDDRERQLEQRKRGLRNRALEGFLAHAREERLAEAADEAVAVTERQAVAADQPQ